MATRNILNSVLSGTTGTGSFVGSTGATLVTPALGVATATSVNLGSSTTISSFINDNSFATASASSGASSSSIKTYADNNVSSVDKIVQYVLATSSTADSTTSASPVDSSLSASITPTSTSNKILVYTNLAVKTEYTGGGTVDARIGEVQIYRSTGTPLVLTNPQFGLVLIAASTVAAPAFSNIVLIGTETAPATSSQTYKVRFKAAAGNTTCYINADSKGPAILVIFELKV